MNIGGVVYESLVDGKGLRTAIFISGCNHNCKGCHNEELQNFEYGKEFTIELQLKLIEEIKKNKLIQGITLTGGDPFLSYFEVIDFINLVKEHLKDINIWIYSGYTYEEIISLNMKDLLCLCDVLVDGRYIESERDVRLKFKGSLNQRIIDIQKSLASGEVILYKQTI